MEKIKIIEDGVKADISLLSRYDESTAKEIDDLKYQSEVLEAQKEQLLIEIDKAKKQLALADKKSRLKEIYAEHERLEGLISELTVALPKMQAKVESFKFDFDISTLEAQYQKAVGEINDANARKETLNRQTFILNEEIRTLKDSIQETVATINAVNNELVELKSKTDTLKTRIEGLDRLKIALSKKSESLQNPYKQGIEDLQSDIKGLSGLCDKMINDYSNLSVSIKGLLNAIKDKSQLSSEIQGQLHEINQLNDRIKSLQAEINQKSVLIDEIVSQTTIDKEKTLSLQREFDGVLNEIQHLSQEIAKIRELTKAKDEAEERFRRLLVENYSYSEGIKTATQSYRKIRDIVRKMS